MADRIPQRIQVLIAVDGEDLVANDKLDKSMDPDKPTNIPQEIASNYIHVLTHKRLSITEDAEGRIKGVVGDTLAWKATTLSLDRNYHVLLYKWEASMDGWQQYITPPKLTKVITSLTTQDNEKPWKMGSPVLIQETEWETQLLKSTGLDGYVVYRFHFALYKSKYNSGSQGFSENELQGFYKWDPYIYIVNTDDELEKFQNQ